MEREDVDEQVKEIAEYVRRVLHTLRTVPKNHWEEVLILVCDIAEELLDEEQGTSKEN